MTQEDFLAEFWIRGFKARIQIQQFRSMRLRIQEFDDLKLENFTVKT
jgi:hypothetical protein